MARNPRRQDNALAALYDKIPPLICRGLCSDCCGPIAMSVRERDRIERQAGKKVECGGGASCSMLTEDRRCSVYEIRPMICRVWGVTRAMRCHYGCRPERWLSDEECMKLLIDAGKVGGDAEGRDRLLAEVEEHRAIAAAVEHIKKHTTPATLEGRHAAMPRRIIDRD